MRSARTLASLSILALATALAGTGGASAAPAEHAIAGTAVRWHAAWSASPQRPSANFTPNWSEQGFTDQTVRQSVRVSLDGVAVRVRLANTYGTTPLTVTGATVARGSGGAAARPGSVRRLTVGGASAFTVPAGAELASDPVSLSVRALDSVTVTLYFAVPTGPATYHAQAMTASYRATGDRTADTRAAAFTESTASWYYLAGVDVIGAVCRREGLVLFGDSLTDGYGSTPGADNRYPDELAERLAATGHPRAVLNQGIGGNRMIVDSAWLGDKATTRFHRDVLDQPGVGAVIVLAGINDIGMSEARQPLAAPHTEVSAAEIIAGHRDLITRAHAKGLRIIGGTMPPTKGSRYYTPLSEAKRDEVNTWIRTSGEYDAVVDFDRALAWPADADQFDPAYDSGDHLHPNDAGYRAMADAVDLADLG
ncbi:SGNH/GDSL hydrolase family protein [Lentzea indica]|uniref:SGNH/GDSL hydrolase family protein n=1 Tax=Lentzea indica TaxID=2604800 RepID=UPI00143BFBD7|nr:SGNH/GDSL hydrolase family protein [Lentzea indica]